jgi:hypothetical protein
MFENIIVLIIVLVAFLFLGKRLLKAFTSRNPGCGCECGADDCPVQRDLMPGAGPINGISPQGIAEKNRGNGSDVTSCNG